VTDAAALWAVVLVAGVGTLLFRLSFVMLFGRLDAIPDRLAFLLRFVPAAVLAALVAPAVLGPLALSPTAPTLVEQAPRLVAACVAVAVAWRTENVFATIGVGMATLWIVGAVV
jgi:branched-subunit amino acid transport protein